jgi:hypothetical protein
MMKNKIFLSMSILALSLMFFACTKDTKEPVLNVSNITASQILFPENGESVVLYEADTANNFPVFQWTATDYHFSDHLQSTTYALQMDVKNSDFAEYVTLTNTDTLLFEITVGELNRKLLELDLVSDSVYNIAFRIASFVISIGSDETAYSNTINLAITPFEAVLYYPPIYVLGDAVSSGWDNNNPIEMPHVGDGVFQVLTELSTNGYFKFISDKGRWVPQWGMSSGTWEEGTLSYRALDSEPDPSAIPAPPQEGLYQITVDTANLIYSLTPQF